MSKKQANDSGKGNPVIPEDLMYAEQQVEEYLTRCGLVTEKGIANEKRAEAIKKRREENYHNIASLLERYRSLQRTYKVFLEEFETEVLDGAKKKDIDGLDVFERLSDRLEVLSVTEEKKFLARYAPHITAGRKIGIALKALKFGLKVLEAESPAMYKIVNLVYIEGETRPSVRTVQEIMGYQSANSYYKKLEQAKRRLSELVFGYNSNRAELISILVFLRQQTEDADFPDYE